MNSRRPRREDHETPILFEAQSSLPSDVSVCGSTLIHDEVTERARQRPTWKVSEVHQYGSSMATVVTTVEIGTVSKKSFFRKNIIVSGNELFEGSECSNVYIGKRALARSLPRYDRTNSCIQWIHIESERERDVNSN